MTWLRSVDACGCGAHASVVGCNNRRALHRMHCLRQLKRFLLRHDQAGGGPAAGPFFLLRQKEVTKKKATARLLPFGFPKAGASQGECRKLASLRHASLFFPCLTPTFGSCLNAGQVNSNSQVNTNTNTNKVVGCNNRRALHRMYRLRQLKPSWLRLDQPGGDPVMTEHEQFQLPPSEHPVQCPAVIAPYELGPRSLGRARTRPALHSAQRYTTLPACAPRSLT